MLNPWNLLQKGCCRFLILLSERNIYHYFQMSWLSRNSVINEIWSTRVGRVYIYSFKKVINLFKYFEKIEKSVNYFEIIFVLYQFVYFVQIYWNISINYKMYGQYMLTVFSMVVSIFRALWDMYVCRNNNNI